MFLDLFHVQLSWCKAIILYPCWHQNAYTLSEFLPQRWNRDNGLDVVKNHLKKSEKGRTYPQKWSDKS